MAIDLKHKYCLLETGQIEPLRYEDGEPRNAYEEDGKFWLDHDVYMRLGGNFFQAYMHSEIIQTSDDSGELLEAYRREMVQDG